MAMLTGPEIARQVLLGGVVIDPFDPARCGSNSYDLTLAPELLVYAKNYPVHEACGAAARRRSPWLHEVCAANDPLDMAADEPTVPLTIPLAGLTLWPGVLYLGATVERTFTPHHVPCISGRSSVGRLGLAVHVTAGFGDLFFDGRWTLELLAAVPVRVYAGVRVCQLYLTTVEGERQPYAGKYAGQTGPRASGMWRDFAAAKANGGAA